MKKMQLEGIKVGFAITGSHCMVEKIVEQIQLLISLKFAVTPILSPSIVNTDTRFGKASSLIEQLYEITGNEPITTIVEAEPVGPMKLFDIITIAPCTGNTLAKLANGITDTAVLMSVKAHLRNTKPVVIAIATNDALSINAKNIGLLLNMKNLYFVPFGQDNPQGKPNSMVAHFNLLKPTLISALMGEQLQPIIKV